MDKNTYSAGDVRKVFYSLIHKSRKIAYRLFNVLAALALLLPAAPKMASAVAEAALTDTNSTPPGVEAPPQDEIEKGLDSARRREALERDGIFLDDSGNPLQAFRKK